MKPVKQFEAVVERQDPARNLTMKHSKKPWFVVKQPNEKFVMAIARKVRNTDFLLAEMVSPEDANLIAAAPEMLELLIRIEKSGRYDFEEFGNSISTMIDRASC